MATVKTAAALLAVGLVLNQFGCGSGDEVQALSEERDNLVKQLEGTSSKLEAARSRSRDLEASLQASGAEKARLEEELGARGNELETARLASVQQLAAVETRCDELAAQKEVIERERLSLAQELADARSALGTLHSEHERQRDEHRSAREAAEASAARVAALEAELDEVAHRAQELETQNISLGEEKRLTMEAMQVLEHSIEDLQLRMETTATQRDLLRQRLATLIKERDKAREDLSQTRCDAGASPIVALRKTAEDGGAEEHAPSSSAADSEEEGSAAPALQDTQAFQTAQRGGDQCAAERARIEHQSQRLRRTGQYISQLQDALRRAQLGIMDMQRDRASMLRAFRGLRARLATALHENAQLRASLTQGTMH
jgi:chromosome segregation ATPase